ncbi:MAG: hypothetical protein HY657_00265 [Acidobacteria bacterium]|nr:hypothetical protein [Acidobacteriota bacterium]
MSTRVADYREALEHLPAGATLVFRDVGWEEYERLLEDLRERPGLRVTYDDQSKTDGQTAALAAFREKVQQGA